jgi:hypothetical protein
VARRPVALQINTDDSGDLVAAVLYETGEAVAVPIGDADTALALQRLRDLDVPTDVAVRELEQVGLGFDIRDDVRRRSEADMAQWRKTDQERREQLKREFRRQRETQERTPDADS